MAKKQLNTKNKIEQSGFDDTIHYRLKTKQRMEQNRKGMNLKVHSKPKWILSLGYIIFILLMCVLAVIVISIFL
ncbi:hypothetical protein [Rummeliibacillus pycnus]|uniref:hypothetical protein n=1 Tax=Rummeliibacillus pycnus TaxID=101070 RepID=UPI000C9B4C8A|nr:hypothetical protein [Rummeliibacillus pycnus]